MTLSPLTHDAFGEVSVADAYVCRWASLRVPVRSGFDVMANTRASASRCGRSAAAHASSTQALSKKKNLLPTCSLLEHEISQCGPAHELRLVLRRFLRE